MALNWAADKRRRQRGEIVRDNFLAAADESAHFYDAEPDNRPTCPVCERPVSPKGDEAERLPSGTYVHSSCLGKKFFLVSAEVTFFHEVLIRAVDADRAQEQYMQSLRVLNGAPEDLVVDLAVSETDETSDAWDMKVKPETDLPLPEGYGECPLCHRRNLRTVRQSNGRITLPAHKAPEDGEGRKGSCLGGGREPVAE